MPKGVEIFDGNLVLVTEETAKKVTKSVNEELQFDTESLYGQLKRICEIKGWKSGRAFYMFREITKRDPNSKENRAQPQEPTKELLGYLKHLTIKKAKSKTN